MTINSTTRTAGPFIGNGTASVFPFTFKVFQASDLDVIKLTISTGVESTLVLTTDYTVSLNGDQNSNPGGNVTLTAGALAAGYTLTITSDIANLQPTDLTNQGGFYPEVITDSLDRATIQIQQMAENIGRSIKAPVSDGSVNMELPATSNRASKYLVFDANGLPSVSSGSGTDTALRADLANSTVALAGSSLVGFRASSASSTARTVLDKLRDSVSVKDFGAVGDGVADDTAAINAALLASPAVFLPTGTYKTTAPITLNDSNILVGAGITSIIKNTTGSSVIRSVTPTGARIYHVGGGNFKIEGNTSGAAAGSIGLDMQNVTYASWTDVWINYVETAIRHGNGYPSYYNDYFTCTITSCTTGIDNSSGGNENRFTAMRIGATTGTKDQACSSNTYLACAVEGFTTGHQITGTTATAIRYIGSRLESIVGGAVGIDINAVAAQTQIVAPYFSVATNIADAGSSGATVLYSDEFKINSGTAAQRHVVSKVVKSIASLAPLTCRQEQFTVSSLGGGLANRDIVSFTAPISWPAKVIAGPVINGGAGIVYVNLYNTDTVNTVNFTAGETYLFDSWRYA